MTFFLFNIIDPWWWAASCSKTGAWRPGTPAAPAHSPSGSSPCIPARSSLVGRLRSAPLRIFRLLPPQPRRAGPEPGLPGGQGRRRAQVARGGGAGRFVLRGGGLEALVWGSGAGSQPQGRREGRGPAAAWAGSRPGAVCRPGECNSGCPKKAARRAWGARLGFADSRSCKTRFVSAWGSADSRAGERREGQLEGTKKGDLIYMVCWRYCCDPAANFFLFFI